MRTKKLLPLAALAAISSSCGAFYNNNSSSTPKGIVHPEPLYLSNPELENYSSCNDLQDHVRTILMSEHDFLRKKILEEKSELVIDDKKAVAVSSVQVQEETSETLGATNVQEKGIDEADYVKVGKHHILVAQGNILEVFKKSTLEPIGSLTIENVLSVELFIEEDFLTVVGRTEDASIDIVPLTSSRTRSTSTTVYHYKLQENELPALLKKETISGSYETSRFTKGTLFLVLRKQLEVSFPYHTDTHLSAAEAVAENPVKLPAESGEDFCKNMTKGQFLEPDFGYTQVVALNSAKIVSEVSVLGTADRIYMSSDAIYLSKETSGRAYKLVQSSGLEVPDFAQETITLTKITFEADSKIELNVAAVGMAPGRTKDVWSFKQITDEGHLAVATTTGFLHASREEDKASNHLFVMQQNGKLLDVVGKATGFGYNEDIRSVRYVDKTAYIVTFKKTDPLFAIDVSNPNQPKILGELKIPGFSTYMHPVAPGRVLGLGFDALEYGEVALDQGIQVSLFDVSNPKEMSRIDNKIHGARGSYSDATTDHHAFYFNAATSIAGFPVVELNDWSARTSALAFSGAVFYKVTENSLLPIARISHRDLMPQQCIEFLPAGQWWENASQSLDINRIYQADENIISVSRFGIKVHDGINPAIVKASHSFVAFPEIACPGRVIPTTWD